MIPAINAAAVANCHAHREWREHVVEITEIHRVPGDRWHLGVHRHQEPQRFIEIGRGIKLEVVRTLLNGELIVGQEVASAIRSMTLEHVADDALVQRRGAGVAHCRCIKCFLSEVGQTSHALVVREGVITNQRTAHRPQFVHLHNNPLLAAHRAFILQP